jgi:hypothetical protein
MYNVKSFPGASLRTPIQRRREVGEEKRGEERERTSQIKFYDYSTGRM